ncbi:hypothetical protein J6590_016430, partial [Homalodisca vitripennis]
MSNGLVKRQLRKYDRLFTPYEVVEQIVKSSIPGKFLVTKVNCDEILDFKNWWGKHYKLRTVSDETKNLKRESRVCFGISKRYHFVHRSDLKGYITAYSTINGLDKQTFFMSAQSGTPSAPTRLAYPGGIIPLKEAKANDIKKALQYVPVEHLEFYNEIVNGPIGTAEEEDLSTREISRHLEKFWSDVVRQLANTVYSSLRVSHRHQHTRRLCANIVSTAIADHYGQLAVVPRCPVIRCPPV